MNRRELFGFLVAGVASLALPSTSQKPQWFAQSSNPVYFNGELWAGVWTSFPKCGHDDVFIQNVDGLTKSPDGVYRAVELKFKCPACSDWSLISGTGWIKQSS